MNAMIFYAHGIRLIIISLIANVFYIFFGESSRNKFHKLIADPEIELSTHVVGDECKIRFDKNILSEFNSVRLQFS